ncbi:MAG: translation initiation factor IF-3 [Actinobacteria bacterium]|nr:translation initiation factor IF-3 [Actinomycetota bacterium]MSW25288.1 translation initiation factor IF-3 [Actinomycetota bacterium]MSX96617.1 translation initiation factor IF-3 [Actinomycetota bacterium]
MSIEPRINERIRVPEVRLVGAAGEQIGIVGIEDALRLAMEADLDLVEVAPEAKPPVCKIMDYGKFKYEAAVKAREARKNQVNTVIKEMKLRPKIDQHDYETKKGHIERFLSQGDKVKITIMFRGREQSRPELGYKLLQKLATDIGESAVIESSPLQDGRNMTMVLAPARKTSGGKAAKPAPAKTEYQAPVAQAPVAPAPIVETPVAPAVVVEAPVVEVATSSSDAKATKAPASAASAAVETPVVEAKPVAKKAAAKKAPAAAAKKAAEAKPAKAPAAKKVAAKKEPAAKKAPAKKTSKETKK